MKENKVIEKGIKYNVRVTDLLLFYILKQFCLQVLELYTCQENTAKRKI